MAEGKGTATAGSGSAGSTGADAPTDPALKAAEEKQRKLNAQVADEASRQVGRGHAARVEVFKGKGKDPYFIRVVAGNGEETFVSEGHKNASDAVAQAVENFPTLRLVDLTQSED